MHDLDTIRRHHRLPPRALPALRDAYAAGIADARGGTVPGTPGRRPYGSDEREAIVLVAIATGREQGMTWAKVASELNAAGIRKRNGKPWSASACAGVFRRTKP